ncbi:MAG: type I restriction endonuclease subunit R [Thiocapsa sp.]|uniref:type I restriction endonuclease n=1 Tax=Thiocapsa sp. TaxID=2024551 RepID=UPI001BD00030|nr:type I restriction endonuclease [Thiocapsa sp.]QVL48803.1 MAG: type I restriction endonuclease subunit R [Thiocapsa sp.]
MKPTDTSEKGLESLIVTSLVEGAGYIQGDPKDYDREHAVDLVKLLRFLSDTQPEAVQALGIDQDGPKRTQFLHRLQGEIAKRGVVEVLRSGIKHGPASVALFYGSPTPGNVKAAERYAKNLFSVTRQLRYSRDGTALALDLALFLNGLPIATFELKNKLTKQTVFDAVQRIIITTVQKFPVVLNKIGSEHRQNRFAILIDEAHSSQGGKSTGAMNRVLDDRGVYGDALMTEDEETTEDRINNIMEGRKMLGNASYFAFTATPKNKTLEIFGEAAPPVDGKIKHRPFHSYTMKQAIEEGFILDVLKHYTPVESYYKLVKTVESDPRFDANKAKKKLRHYVESHEYAITEKAGIMVEHFHEQVIAQRKIGGQARAMIITNGIQRAIQYFHAFNTYAQVQIEDLVGRYLSGADRDKLDPILDACVATYNADLDEDGQVDFKGKAKAFVRTYGFLASILPYSNAEWEKLSIFLNFLIPKLPAPKEEDLSKGILEAIDMDSYRAEVKSSLAIALADEDGAVGPVPTTGGGYIPEPELEQLSNIVKAFNDQFGNLDWKDKDRIEKVLAEEVPAKVSADTAYHLYVPPIAQAMGGVMVRTPVPPRPSLSGPPAPLGNCKNGQSRGTAHPDSPRETRGRNRRRPTEGLRTRFSSA